MDAKKERKVLGLPVGAICWDSAGQPVYRATIGQIAQLLGVPTRALRRDLKAEGWDFPSRGQSERRFSQEEFLRILDFVNNPRTSAQADKSRRAAIGGILQRVGGAS
jgi:hypothetical protein